VKLPLYLTNLLSKTVGEVSNSNLRNALNYEGIFARTEKFKNSFYPKTIQEYNNLPANIKFAPTVTSFKLLLNTKLNKIKNWFYIGDRKLSIIQARLRMKCSSLKSHLFHLNIVESARCLCGCAYETPHHYFFECPLFHTERIQFLVDLKKKIPGL